MSDGMTDNEEAYFLASISLEAREWNGVLELSKALSEFEPLAKRVKIGHITADRLLELGLAEKGECGAPYVSRGMAVGYRLTPLGWAIKERGRCARNSAPTQT